MTLPPRPPLHATAAADPDCLLHIDALSVSFGARRAVDELELKIRAGQTVALVGESGCGKSTTALALMRLLPPRTSVGGAIWFNGRDLNHLGERDLSVLRGREVSMIFQEPMSSLNPVHTIGKQVSESLTLHQPLSGREARLRAIELLDRVKLPNAARRFDDYPHQLSGGQRQRVMIAMAIASRPKLLIADEPTTALDVTVQAEILTLIDQLRRELGMAVLLITHDLGLVAQWADRVAVMFGGRKLEEGPVGRVFSIPAHPYTQGLLGASLHSGDDLHYRTSRLAEIRADGVGGFSLTRPAPVVWPEGNPRSSAESLLRVQNLSVVYDDRPGAARAVDDVSFTIAAGETLGLVGESGCGKSSLSRAIIRLIDARSGRVTLDGQDLLTLSARDLLPWRRRVQMVFQDPYGSLNPRHRIEDILGHALRIHGVSDRLERERRIDAILDDVGLGRLARRRYPHEFSGGQRQRIGIARALVLRPELLICDEPVSALDVSVQAQILNLLVDLKAAHGLSYLFISHDLAVVRYIADRVLVMQAGRIVEAADHQRIWTDPQHPYTRSLLAAVPGRHENARPAHPPLTARQAA